MWHWYELTVKGGGRLLRRNCSAGRVWCNAHCVLIHSYQLKGAAGADWDNGNVVQCSMIDARGSASGTGLQIQL